MRCRWLALVVLLAGCGESPEPRFAVGDCIIWSDTDPWEKDSLLSRIDAVGQYSYKRTWWLDGEWAKSANGMRFEKAKYYKKTACP